MRKMIIIEPLAVLLLFNMLNCSAVGGPPVPTKAVIESDLIGRRLSEGVDKGYFPLDWNLMVEQGQISGLTIISQDVTDDYCSFVVGMTLQKMSSPTKYKATVQMGYSLLNKKWQLVLVKSMGVNIVKTDKYLDCISFVDKWGSAIWIRNNVDSPLLVGGVYWNGDSKEWVKFSKTINGLEEEYVGYGADCKIHFVEPL